MVFDGQGPLVKRWNGFNGLIRSKAASMWIGCTICWCQHFNSYFSNPGSAFQRLLWLLRSTFPLRWTDHHIIIRTITNLPLHHYIPAEATWPLYHNIAKIISITVIDIPALHHNNLTLSVFCVSGFACWAFASDSGDFHLSSSSMCEAGCGDIDPWTFEGLGVGMKLKSRGRQLVMSEEKSSIGNRG